MRSRRNCSVTDTYEGGDTREVGAGTQALIMPEDDCTGQLFPELQLFSPRNRQARP